MIILNHGYTIFFTVEIDGVATAADSTPTAVLYRNGSASGVTVTVVTTATTGLYKATFTSDAGWAKTDVLHLVVSATIAATSGYICIAWDSTGDVDAIMRGTDNANTTAPDNASIAAILVDTAEIGVAGAGLTALATATNLATVAGYLDTEIAAILADTNELQTDWANGGRLDVILDARSSQTSVDTIDTVVDAIKVKTDQLAFTVANQVDANALTGGGGGASAEDIVDEIEDRGITTVPVQSGVTSATVMELVQGDTYNGTGKPLISFTVAVDYTDGWTATLTIRDEDDAVVSTTTGTVASSTSITFSMTAPTGLAMIGCPGSWKGKFDVQMSKSSNRVTITRGTCYVYEDQTRT